MPEFGRILLPTDVFPPRCGGAGWSAHALARALRAHGNDVLAVVPHGGMHGERREIVGDVPVLRVGYRDVDIPFVKNYFRHERLWPRIADALVREERAGRPSSSHNPLVIHAQHVQVAPAAVMAGAALRTPVVVTVRDHWPWDYFATGLHGGRIPYAAQTWASLAADLPVRLKPVRGALALPAIPYMLAHLRRRQAYLNRADAVIAVSPYIAQRLARVMPAERITVIPNMVDLSVLDAVVKSPAQSVAPGTRFWLYVGKLEQNKGAQLLPEIMAALPRAQLQGRRLVIAGNGPLRARLQQELDALGIATLFLEWADHDEVLRLMARCECLLFPSAWGEPLSRVLLEACACGAPIIAMPTGGTRGLLADGVNGWLEATASGFGRRLSQLCETPRVAQELSAGARRLAEQQFDQRVVLKRVLALYEDLRTRR